MRYKGTFPYSSNIESRIKAPLDARTKVQNYSDLINPLTWVDAEGLNWLYRGILVSVTDDSNNDNNGIYRLLDETSYTNESSWQKIGDGFWEIDNVEKVGYGYLYNWHAVNESVTHGGFIDGFRVPSDTEWSELTTLLGGDSVSGGKLKSVRTDPDIPPRWDTPNTDATDEVNFSALPGGYRLDDGTFSHIGMGGYLWSSTEFNTLNSWIRILGYSDGNVYRFSFDNESGYSVRCIRDLTTSELLLTDGTLLPNVLDYDGVTYEVVKIGNYAWTRQNLACEHYVDGTVIPNVIDNTEWGNLTTGAYCIYNNNSNLPGLYYSDEFIQGGIKPKNNEYVDAKHIKNLPEGGVQSDWNETDPLAKSYIKNKPNLVTEEIFPITITRNIDSNIIRTIKDVGDGKFIENRFSWTNSTVLDFEEVKNDLTGEFKRITYNYDVNDLLESTTIIVITEFSIVIP